MWIMLFYEYSLIIKCDWEKFCPKIEKWLTPTIKDEKVL